MTDVSKTCAVVIFRVKVSCITLAGFSPNFSSAGKGPFMDGKAKNIHFSRGVGGAVEGGTRAPPSLGNFFIPIF